MNLFKLVGIISMLLCLTNAHGQQKTAIVALAKSKQDGIWLRWAPADITAWQLGNRYGYSIERFTLSANGEMESGSSKMLTTSPLKPLTKEEFEKASAASDEVAVLQEFLYNEEFNKPFNADDVSSVLSKSQELENRLGMALLMCDLSLDAARAAGLFWKDTNVQKGKRYIYRIRIASPTLPLEPAVIVVSFTEEKAPLAIKDLGVKFTNLKVTLSWPTLLHKGEYTAYYIEKSTDGKNFARISYMPYVHMTEKLESEIAYFVDSLENNQQKFYYRLRGISPFAEVGPPSNVVEGHGQEDLAGLVIIRQGKVTQGRSVRLVWEFPVAMETQIEGFVVTRSNSPDGPYITVTKKPLSKKLREFTDETNFNNTYYAIRAVDKTGNEITRSFPYLVQIEDNTPPQVPSTLQGTVDKQGIVKLTWKANADTDLLGYRVFRSNALHEELIEVTKEILTAPVFIDTVNISVLNRKLFYAVIAVDKNYNTSDYSNTVTVMRPDVIPPVAPVFIKAEIVYDSIMLRWINSASQDVAKYELMRIEKEDKLTRVLMTWSPLLAMEQYADKSLTIGKTYSYKVVAYDSAGNKSEALSKLIRCEPIFRKAVSVKSVVDRENKTITLQWRNEKPVIKYIVYRKVNNDPFRIYVTREGNSESFADNNLFISNSYAYKIQLVFEDGVKSEMSQEVKVNF